MFSEQNFVTVDNYELAINIFSLSCMCVKFAVSCVIIDRSFIRLISMAYHCHLIVKSLYVTHAYGVLVIVSIHCEVC